MAPSHGMSLIAYHIGTWVKWSFPPFTNLLFWANGGFQVQAALSAKLYRQYILDHCPDIQEVLIQYSQFADFFRTSREKVS